MTLITNFIITVITRPADLNKLIVSVNTALFIATARTVNTRGQLSSHATSAAASSVTVICCLCHSKDYTSIRKFIREFTLVSDTRIC